MTTAHNFPDISLSPIQPDYLTEDEENDIDLHISLSPEDSERSRANSVAQDSVVQITLPVEIDGSSIDPGAHSSQNHRGPTPFRPPRSRNVSSHSSGRINLSTSVVSSRVCIDDSSIALEISLDSTNPPQNSQHSRFAGDVIPESEDDFNDVIEGAGAESNSLQMSSEEVFTRLEDHMRATMFTEDSSIDVAADDVTDSPTGKVLRGIRIFVDLKCCLESATSVKTKLRRMGAIVSRKMTPTTSHVIFARNGSKQTLRSAMSMDQRPFLLDPHWVHDCFFNKSRVPEENYSLYGARFLIDSLRRVSSAAPNSRRPSSHVVADSASTDCIELSPDDGLGARAPVSTRNTSVHPITGSQSEPRPSSSISLSEQSDMTFEQPMTATQLLSKIDKLSKRLDNCEGSSHVDVHGARCPSRVGVVQPTTAVPAPSNRADVATNTLPKYPQSTPLRRRTHGGYHLPHRAPESATVLQMKADREEKNAVCGMSDITNRMGTVNINPAQNPINGINDMRKTAETNLNNIRQTLQNNSQYQQQQQQQQGGRRGRPRRMPLRGAVAEPPTQPPLVELTEDEEESIELRTPQGRVRKPIVKTASVLINRMQCVPSSDEFAGEKQSRIRKNGHRMGIVFTGLTKPIEREQRANAASVSLKIQNRLDRTTRCVVSATGQRTLTTLRAVVMGVPVVNLDWLETCQEESRLVPTRRFEYEDWRRSIQARGEKCSLFSRIGRILVVDGCAPPAEDLRWMIRKSGGKVTSSINECSLVVTPAGYVINIPWRRRSIPPPPVVSEKYILDCITKNLVVSLDPYLEESILEEDA